MKVKSAQEAANRGFDAAMAGVSRDENPYSANSPPLQMWWDLGWLEYGENVEKGETDEGAPKCIINADMICQKKSIRKGKEQKND